MRVRDSGGPIEVDDEMAVGRDLVDQRIQQTIPNPSPFPYPHFCLNLFHRDLPQ